MNCLKTWVMAMLGICFFMGLAGNAQAHFGMILPSTEIATQNRGGTIILTVMSAHPFKRNWMDMARPARFGVKVRGSKEENLLPLLKPMKIHGHTAWKATYRLKCPGDYVFFDQPQPYFEPAEEKFLMHYTKVIINGYGIEKGWDTRIGLKADQNGVFAYAMPAAGWRGFAALNEDSKKMTYKGKAYPVELGAVLGVRTRNMERRK